MNILVVGGAGYIGSHVVRELLDQNYNVIVYDNLSSGSRKNLFKETDFIQGDILDHVSLENVLQNNSIDAVFHFAAFKAAGESMINPQKYAENNINGTLNLLNSITKFKINNFIFSSSAAVYGEPQYLPIDEKHKTDPQNFYGFTKLEIERFLKWYDQLCNLKYAALRYFNAAGYDDKNRIKDIEKNPQNLLPSVMEVASGTRDKLLIFGDDYPTVDGTGVRDYIHVTDLAKAHVQALNYLITQKKSITVNLGSETGISVKQILDTARKITGKTIPAIITDRRNGDCASLYATSKTAERLLNWKVQHSTLENLVLSTWNQYQAQ